MITNIISKTINLPELEELETVKRDLCKAIRKHKRKLILTKLYLNLEIKYESKTVKRGASRVLTLRLFGKRTQITELTITLNRLCYLIEDFQKNVFTIIKNLSNF